MDNRFYNAMMPAGTLLWLGLIGILISCNHCPSAIGMDLDTKRPTVEEVINGIRKAEKLLFESESMLMRYEMTNGETVVSGAADLLPIEWIFAYRGNKWFVQSRFTHPYQTKDLLVSGLPVICLIKNKNVLDWRQESNAVLSDLGLGRNIYMGLDYISNLSLNGPKYIAKSLEIENRMDEIRKLYRQYVDLPFLPDFLVENQSRYEVLSTPETVANTECWVLEWPGMDRIWTDPKHGFCVVRRAYSWGPGKPLRYDILNSDYKEVKPGLWLPFTQKQDRYFSPEFEDPKRAGKIKVIANYKLREIQFDKLTDAFFDIKLPTDTRVFDRIRNFKYTVSDDNSDPFAFSIVQGMNDLKPTNRIWWVAINVLVIIVIVIALFALRRRTDKHPSADTRANR